MEIKSTKVYNLDNGKLSICRHFREKTSPEELIKNAVLKGIYEPAFLTGGLENARIQPDSGMPLRQLRRAGEQR